jgi:hypothetical protein
MASVLTEHVRTFGPTSDPTGQVLPALERLLRYRMRQKNLLSAPPEFLGYPTVANWSAPDAFEDIVVDCYIFAIAQRITALQNQLRIKPNVDGLISRNVANFLLERQRKHDPIGYAVFGNVCGAAQDAAAAEEIQLENLDRGKLCSQSILRLGGSPSTAPATRAQIRTRLDTAAGWADNVRWLTETTEEGRDWVRGFLRGFPAAGITAVVCGDLVDVVAARVRSDWRARHAEPSSELAREGDDEFATTVRMVWPDVGIEARERWEQLKRVIPERIAGLDRQTRVRERLAVVFAALVRAVESGGAAPPTQADLIERTGIPRATLSDDMRVLREIVSGFDAQKSDA